MAMRNELRIRRDRSSLSNGTLFGRRRGGMTATKWLLWLGAIAFLGVIYWQSDKLQPQVQAMVGNASTPTPPALYFAKAADNAFWRGDLDTAITNYREAVKQYPTDVAMVYELARMLIYHSYADRRNVKDAVEALDITQKLVESNPTSARAYTIHCYALLTNDKLEDAVRACVRAIDLNPNEADAHAYLATTYSSLVRMDAALEEAQKAVQLNDKSIDAHRSYAAVLWYKGKPGLAMDEYKKAADVNPQLEFPYFELAYFAVGTNQYEIAINAYNRILSVNKSSVKAYTRLCETYYRMGETNMARDNCENAISLDSTYTAAYKWLGQVLYTRRNYEDAVTDFEKCAEMEKDFPPEDRFTECWYLRGLALFILGQCDEATVIFNDILTWTNEPKAIEMSNIGINKCATAYQGLYKTPTPAPTATVPPPPIFDPSDVSP
jgi:tetratricopeptide (TPR) repeat protein